MLNKILCWIFCGLVLGFTVKAQESIALHYNERVPYLMGQTSGVVQGLTADPANMAFEKAAILFQWIETPPKRQMWMLQQNIGRDCLVGWFKNKEREKFAKYTFPIYQDKPTIALARADNKQLKSGMKLSEIFSNPRFAVIVKDGYSYGAYIDKLLSQYKPHLVTTGGDNVSMLKMIYKKHGDYFFIAEEEANHLITSTGLSKSEFKYVRFSDMPKGEKRYILCSQKVEDEVIERLNAAILTISPMNVDKN